MNAEHAPYFHLTKKSRLDKSINSLIGIIEGITIDGTINSSELDFLILWLGENKDVQDRHPFNELMPVVAEALVDGVLTDDERQDILWLCERLRSNEYFHKTTADLQRLHAIFAGIAADVVISEAELRGLSDWLEDHKHLKTCWPYDEIDSLIISVLADRKIDDDEHEMLLRFFSEFISLADDKTIASPVLSAGNTLAAVCASCPEIRFQGAKFCFTGVSAIYKRIELAETVKRLGGEPVKSVTADLDYLIIGADGNPCWAFACYGRKIEKAVDLRKSGARLMIVHENDFHDAVADQR
jgi:hypothetical protein